MFADAPADATALHHNLIDHLKANQELSSRRLEAAFRAVPRHLFLPGHPLEIVYRDQAIPTKVLDDRAVSSSSQPAMMAIMLEQLDLRRGQRVLEIGAGTGYNAALMAHLVGDSGQVTTIDLDEEIVLAARSHLTAAGFEGVEVVHGDGIVGYAANAPYDRIVLTVGGWDISLNWLDQLAPGGRLLLPLSLNGPQLSIAFERRQDHLTSVSIAPCGFMRLRGPMAEIESRVRLGNQPGLYLEFNTVAPTLDAEAAFQWLNSQGRYWATGVTTELRQIFRDVRVWLALHEPYPSLLIAQDEAVELGIVPYLFGADGEQRIRLTPALVSESGLAMLTYAPDGPAPLIQAAGSGKGPAPFELYVRGCGPDDSVASRLVALIQRWDQLGQPSAAESRIRVYPLSATIADPGDAFTLKRRWHQFLIEWPHSPTADTGEPDMGSSQERRYEQEA